MKKANNSQAALLGLQHLLAMYSGAVAVPLLIGTALGFNTEQMTYLVSIDIFMCGLATLLQLMRNRYFGIGLPVVLGRNADHCYRSDIDPDRSPKYWWWQC